MSISDIMADSIEPEMQSFESYAFLCDNANAIPVVTAQAWGEIVGFLWYFG
jgi:hypothetical protein